MVFEIESGPRRAVVFFGTTQKKYGTKIDPQWGGWVGGQPGHCGRWRRGQPWQGAGPITGQCLGAAAAGRRMQMEGPLLFTFGVSLGYTAEYPVEVNDVHREGLNV